MNYFLKLIYNHVKLIDMLNHNYPYIMIHKGNYLHFIRVRIIDHNFNLLVLFLPQNLIIKSLKIISIEEEI